LYPQFITTAACTILQHQYRQIFKLAKQQIPVDLSHQSLCGFQFRSRNGDHSVWKSITMDL